MFFVQKRVSRKDTLPRMKLVNRDESPSRRLSWRNCETTWRRGTQYFHGLIRPRNNKSIPGIASMVDIKQEKLERFV
jgi:hypothetical protein